MTEEEANRELKKLVEWYEREKEELRKKAKENGTYVYGGLDTNRELYTEIDKKYNEEFIRIMLDSDEEKRKQ